jgi:hypothetical protein
MDGSWGRKQNSVHPIWDERWSIRGATRLRLTGVNKKFPGEAPEKKPASLFSDTGLAADILAL